MDARRPAFGALGGRMVKDKHCRRNNRKVISLKDRLQSNQEPLGVLGQSILRHWEEFRPKDVRDLRQAGKLYQHVRDLQDRGRLLLGNLRLQGFNQVEANELLAELVYPPSEKDMSVLGESES